MRVYGSQWGSLDSFPGLSWLQFLIACSMQKLEQSVFAYWMIKNWRTCLGMRLGEALRLQAVYKKPYFLLQVTRESISGTTSLVCWIRTCNEIEGSYDKTIIPIVPSYTGKTITRLLLLALLLVLSTRNNTDGSKLLIFSSIALYYGDTHIISCNWHTNTQPHFDPKPRQSKHTPPSRLSQGEQSFLTEMCPSLHTPKGGSVHGFRVAPQPFLVLLDWKYHAESILPHAGNKWI